LQPLANARGGQPNHSGTWKTAGANKNSHRRQASGRSHQPDRRLRGDSIPQVIRF